MVIYASPDNWRTCYSHMPVGMLGIYRLLFVFLFVFLSAGYFGNGYLGRRRGMKFCRMVDLAVNQVISPFGELWPRGEPTPKPKSEKKLVTHIS